PLFVPMVEKGILYGEQAEQVIEETLRPVKITTNIDTLVLGCTHYPLLETTIKKVMGPDVHIISSSEETARETSTILEMNNQLYAVERESLHQFYSTGDINIFKHIAALLFIDKMLHVLPASFNKIDL